MTLFVLDERAVTLGSSPKAFHTSDTQHGTMVERRRMETRGKTSFPKILNKYIRETLPSFSPRLSLLGVTLAIRVQQCVLHYF